MIQDDEKYKALRDTLRSLPRVKAKGDFESRLMQRISAASNPVVHVTKEVKKESAAKSWLSNLFRPALMPAMGLTAVLLITVVVYFAYFSKLNNGSPENTQQFVSSTNQGDLIIYVKKDGDDISGNYPKDYSAVNPEDTRSGELFAPPTETSSDFLAKPDPGRTLLPDNKPDRVSEEQRIEMQRSVDLDDKGVDVKGERKSDDGMIMKKESKGYFKTETKGELKSETDKSPYNIRDEKKNENENNEVNQEQKVAPKKKISKTEDSIKQQTDEESQNRISRATKKDSTQNKSDSEAEEKETNKK